MADEHARYFHADTAEQLAATLEQWFQALADGDISDSSGMPWLTWRDSAQQLLAAMQGGWYRSLTGPEQESAKVAK